MFHIFSLPSSRWGVLSAVIWAASHTVINAQVNAWTSPSSGNWEDSHWSLGMLPASGQSVVLNNPGWKAVAIEAHTAQAYPQTLAVQSLTISSPADSYNVLLLSFAGYQTPLTASTMTINSNAALTVLGSMLEVTNTGSSDYRLEIGGTVNQGEYSAVAVSFLSLGNVGPGVYNLTNGSLNIGTGFVGGAFHGQINQFGGDTLPNLLRIDSTGECDLFGGLMGGLVQLWGGTLKQSGGRFNGMLQVEGTYLLQDGLFTGAMAVPASIGDGGTVLQAGGTNQPGWLTVGFGPGLGGGYPGAGNYSLSNGLLLTSGTLVGTRGYFSQYGGIHTIQGPLSLSGAFGPPRPGYWWAGYYTLYGGRLSASSMTLQIGEMSQEGGTNEIAGDLTLGGEPETAYHLDGGLLLVSNTIIFKDSYQEAFVQNGGVHKVANRLEVADPYGRNAGYSLNGGQLIAPYIQVEDGAVFTHSDGTVLQNSRLTLIDGTWNELTGGQQFGQLQLGSAAGTNSILSLGTNACVVRFADSSDLVWSNLATLTLEGWAGSFDGGGPHQIIFGNAARALSDRQLRQIMFHNPAGLAPGAYPARILVTGEIVPEILLSLKQIGNRLVLNWSSGQTLQTATNAAGPYLNLLGNPSPYTNQFQDPIRFFRLVTLQP